MFSGTLRNFKSFEGRIKELATKIAAISKRKFGDIVERLKFQLSEGLIVKDHIISWNKSPRPPSIICDNCGRFMYEDRLIITERPICGSCIGELQKIILETRFKGEVPLPTSKSRIKTGSKFASEVVIAPVGVGIQLDDSYINECLKNDLLNFSFVTGTIFYLYFNSVGPILFQVRTTTPKGRVFVNEDTSVTMEVFNELQ